MNEKLDIYPDARTQLAALEWLVLTSIKELFMAGGHRDHLIATCEKDIEQATANTLASSNTDKKIEEMQNAMRRLVDHLRYHLPQVV